MSPVIRAEKNKTAALSIKLVAERCGVSPSVLRIWEKRYKWPCPQRRGNGYRLYSERDVAGIQVVKNFIKLGRSIPDILADADMSPLLNPGITLDVIYPKRHVQQHLDFNHIPMPVSTEGRRLRAQLEVALQTGHAGARDLVLAQAVRLSPRERTCAVDELVSYVSRGAEASVVGGR